VDLLPARLRDLESGREFLILSITMIHCNGVRIQDNRLTVDRKFHVGMLRYAQTLRAPIVAINPPLAPSEKIMDAVEVPLNELPYQIFTTTDTARMVAAIRAARLVYGYEDFMQAGTMARSFGVPYIMTLEYDLQTQMVENSSKVSGLPRKLARRARSLLNYYAHIVPAIRQAHSLHCNGYPIYEATAGYNDNRLLYLDSRMSQDSLISDGKLRVRLETLGQRTVRLLYSGRYEPMKGALDVIRVGRECLRRGMNIEMHCYGQGSQHDAMVALAGDSAIKVHAAIPYPELVKLAHTFDLFVCCHIQSDPSCTYLESMGAGLPIAGYENRMWRGLRQASAAGAASPLGNPGQVVDSIQRLLSEPNFLQKASANALSFARAHTFETEFQKRVAALNSAAS